MQRTFREIRTDKGLTTSFVAKHIGLCVNTLLAKERGERSFTARETQMLCELYKVNICEVKI